MALTAIPRGVESVSEEASDDGKSSIAPDDVLMGRGARATENEGNVRFRQIVRSRLNDYLLAPRRHEKDQIAREILGVVKSRNGKFLRKVEDGDDGSQGSNGYVAVEDDVALLKVKQALRDQKLEESANACQKSAVIKNGSISAEGHVSGAKRLIGEELMSLNLPGVNSARPNLCADVESILVRQFLNELRSQAFYTGATCPSSASHSGLGYADGLFPAQVLLQDHHEALLTSVLLAQTQTLQALSGTGYMPSVGSQLLGQQAFLSSPIDKIEAESLLKVLHTQPLFPLGSASLDLRRIAELQCAYQVLDAQRDFKRRRFS